MELPRDHLVIPSEKSLERIGKPAGAAQGSNAKSGYEFDGGQSAEAANDA
jgi:hypothetical protein